MHKFAFGTLALFASAASACTESTARVEPSPSAAPLATVSAAPSGSALAAKSLSRADFNRLAVRHNLPLFWAKDTGNGSPRPSDVRSLLFFPTEGHWSKDGKATPEFDAAVASLSTKAAEPAGLAPEEVERRKLVGEELDAGSATLLYTDFSKSPDADKAFVKHMLTAAKSLDLIYATMAGMKALEGRVAKDDVESQSLFRRNWGPVCQSPKLQKEPHCSALPLVDGQGTKRINDAYPAEMQSDPKFCQALEKLPNEKELLDHFSVVREGEGKKLKAVKYTEAYADPMGAIAKELSAAAAETTDPKEAALKAYLEAAAQSFTTNDWAPADEAWAKMNAQNSKWYLRVAPDEVSTDPCGYKAQFHLNLARINTASLAWQEKLTPVEQEMEQSLGTLIGAPYTARKVTFHLPDFIDIVFNAGEDRNPFGAVGGESLPNWGKVATEGRGRTVAMSNLYTDPDSLAVRHNRAASLFDAASLKSLSDSTEPSLLSTILHEATHNLGPISDYTFKGKRPEAAFGGKLSSMLEELKAQSGALYYIEFLRKKGLVSDELAKQTYADSLAWCLRHISQGMHSGTGDEPYSQLSAIQIGFLMDEGAIAFDAGAAAANGTDKGALVIHYEKLPQATEKLMKVVSTIKAVNDKKGADDLVAKYVDGTTVPFAMIAERELRYPQQTVVYSVDL